MEPHEIRFYPNKTVVRVDAAAVNAIDAQPLTPNIYIVITVDVAYIIGKQGQAISEGIYMMDNMVMAGSDQQGPLSLHTVGKAGDLVGWRAVPIDPYLPNQSIEISFIQICTGNVFGSPPLPQTGNGYSWIGQLMYQGIQSYALQIKVSEGFQTVSYYVNWQASISC